MCAVDCPSNKKERTGEDQRSRVKILCKVYKDWRYRGHSWEHKGQATNNRIRCTAFRFKSITWAQCQGWNSASPISEHLNHFSEQKTLWIRNPLGTYAENHVHKPVTRIHRKKLHWFWERSTWNILSKLLIHSPEEGIKMVISHTRITRFKRCPQTRKGHKFSPNYLRTTAFLPRWRTVTETNCSSGKRRPFSERCHTEGEAYLVDRTGEWGYYSKYIFIYVLLLKFKLIRSLELFKQNGNIKN